MLTFRFLSNASFLLYQTHTNTGYARCKIAQKISFIYFFLKNSKTLDVVCFVICAT